MRKDVGQGSVQGSSCPALMQVAEITSQHTAQLCPPVGCVACRMHMPHVACRTCMPHVQYVEDKYALVILSNGGNARAIGYKVRPGGLVGLGGGGSSPSPDAPPERPVPRFAFGRVQHVGWHVGQLPIFRGSSSFHMSTLQLWYCRCQASQAATALLKHCNAPPKILQVSVVDHHRHCVCGCADCPRMLCCGARCTQHTRPPPYLLLEIYLKVYELVRVCRGGAGPCL